MCNIYMSELNMQVYQKKSVYLNKNFYFCGTDVKKWL